MMFYQGKQHIVYTFLMKDEVAFKINGFYSHKREIIKSFHFVWDIAILNRGSLNLKYITL